MPDKMHEFAVEFITRHKDHPFYLYYAMTHVHEPILPTPDSKPGTTDKNTLYQDNVSYMDKLVGKLLAEIDRLHLREKTIVVFGRQRDIARICPYYHYPRQTSFRLEGLHVGMWGTRPDDS